MPKSNKRKTNKTSTKRVTNSKITKTTKPSSTKINTTSPKTTKPSSSKTIGNTNDSFPLGNLPAELRDKIWEECIALQLASHSSHQTETEMKGYRVNFYSLKPPAAALACRESYAAATRMQQRVSNKGAALYEQSFQIPILENLAKISLRHGFLEQHNFYLIPHALLDEENKGGWSTHGRRMFDLLSAARDDQVKVILRDTESFFLPRAPPAPPACARRWAQKEYLVSLNDRNVWAELKGIADFYGLEWDFADVMLATEGDKLEERRRIVEGALAPLRALWDGEVRRRRRRRKGKEEGEEEEETKMPRIDVCAYVEVEITGQGITLGFVGVPDRRIWNSLIDYGIL